MSKFLVVVMSALLVACGSGNPVVGDPLVGSFVEEARNIDYTISITVDGRYILDGTLFGKKAEKMHLIKLSPEEVRKVFNKRSAEVVTYLVNEDRSLYFGYFDIEKANYDEMPRDLIPNKHWDGNLIRGKHWLIPVYTK